MKQGDILVERVHDELDGAMEAPRAVHEQQLAQVAELGDRVVGRRRRLQAFVARDGDADVRCL